MMIVKPPKRAAKPVQRGAITLPKWRLELSQYRGRISTKRKGHSMRSKKSPGAKEPDDQDTGRSLVGPNVNVYIRKTSLMDYKRRGTHDRRQTTNR